MKKVFIKRNIILNEDVNITDPTLAQQYLAVKKQVSDKKIKRDQQMKAVNQTENEINILEKNLIAIETKASSKTQTPQKSENKQQQNISQNQNVQTNNTEENTNESFNSITPFNNYIEQVICEIDEVYHDGETLVYEYHNLIKKYFKEKKNPKQVANIIITMEKSYVDNENFIGGDTEGKMNVLRSKPIKMSENVNESLNESVYDDMVNDIQKEINKLSDIRQFIENYDNNKQDNNIDDKETTGIWNVSDLHKQQDDNINFDIDLEDKDLNFDNSSNEINDVKDLKSNKTKDYDFKQKLKGKELQGLTDDISEEDPFKKSEEENVVDETLKVEIKEPFVPNLIESEDLENELEMLNYEDEDQPIDEYVFYVKIDEDTDDEIIAKIYKENEDDDWTIRVVKGDEQPLQSMQFDGRLNKIELLGYLADIYDDVEIMEKEEYQYLLDDKEKTDEEFFNKDDEENENEDEIEDED